MKSRSSSSGNEFNVLAAAAHDFKSPLALIAGLASELKYSENPDEIGHSARQIIETSESLMRMIDTVSTARQLEQTELELELSPVDLASVINKAAYDLTSLASDYEHSLDVRISRRLPTVMAHKPSVQRMVTSLLDTAIRSAKPRQKIQMTAKKIGEEVILSVTDATSGIKPAEWAKITSSPGKQIISSPALGDSSGVLLYAISHLAQAMNGDFTTSGRGKDSVFMLRLPQVAQMRLF